MKLQQSYDFTGLKAEKLDGTGGTGFYDGKGFVLKLTGTAFKDKFK